MQVQSQETKTDARWRGTSGRIISEVEIDAAADGNLNRRRMFPLWFLIVFAANGGGQELKNDSTDFRAIDAYVTGKMRSARIPGLSLAIVKGDQVVYLKGFGRADPSGRAVTPQTPFMIGSITKPFTALAVMQLVDSGKVDLDAPVQRYIPWFRVADPRASAQITVRELMTMTSGIPQSYETQRWTRQDDRAIEATVRLLQTAQQTGPVGQSLTYSNANYETLGMIIQAVSGLSYEEYMQEHIFAPLEMRNTFVSQTEAIRHGMASGHRWWFGIPVAVTLPYNRAELPAGYIIASAEDMTHFLIAEMNDGRYKGASVLSPRGMTLRHTAPAKGYGLGWEFPQVNGRELINHDGGTANFQSALFIDPQAKVGVYIAVNVTSAVDAFASPSGTSPLDGATTRAMAEAVLSMAASQPLPDQGRGHERLTLSYDLILAILTAALVLSLARTPARLRRLSDRGIANQSDWLRHFAKIAILNLALPIVVLYVTLNVPAWTLIVEFEPDLSYWLEAVAIILLIKGVFEMAFATSLFRRTQLSDDESLMQSRAS